jgi:hypothetical protein
MVDIQLKLSKTTPNSTLSHLPGKREAELEEQRKKAEFAAAVERARRMKIDPWLGVVAWFDQRSNL